MLDEDAYERAKRDMARILSDAGYAYDRVSGQSQIDLARHEARLRFEIDAGPPAVSRGPEVSKKFFATGNGHRGSGVVCCVPVETRDGGAGGAGVFETLTRCRGLE